MKKVDINSQVFSSETKLKLDIFRRYFREWYPVFIHYRYINELYIFDLFAGSGTDKEENYGSPLILLDEIKGDKRQYCLKLYNNSTKKVELMFNEKDEKKLCKLKKSSSKLIAECGKNCSIPQCPYRINYCNKDFTELIKKDEIINILNDPHVAKFIILDQYGFKQIDDHIFLRLVESPKTDFIFFIASSFVRRFKQTLAVQKYFKEKNLNFDESKPKECHRVITEYFRNSIPKDRDYYIHSFTIKKGSNYYGLIFGTEHSLGMEKFVKVCWEEDPSAGESNCNINDDFPEGTLFRDDNKTEKKQLVFKEIRDGILNDKIRTNCEGLKYALKRGCLPKLYVDVVTELLSKQLISIDGKFNRQATNIHKVKKYTIIRNENNQNRVD
ncbi:MAG: three-Cys-motif partner protein TcmP [Prevotella sp.]|nr:three-Cys-motif partner protein TcmP [Prevotella sp.]